MSPPSSSGGVSALRHLGQSQRLCSRVPRAPRSRQSAAAVSPFCSLRAWGHCQLTTSECRYALSRR
eukprot:6544006-Pyramimonas_sp.AAC.1